MRHVSIVVAIKFRIFGKTLAEPCVQVIVTPGGEEVRKAAPLVSKPKFDQFGIKVWVSKELAA